MTPRRFITRMFPALLVAAIAAGCAGPGGEVAPHDRVAETIANPESALHIGMSAEEVTGFLGKPDEVHALASSNGLGETWIYRTRVTRGTDLVSGRTESRPYYDPFTGQVREIQEPVYTQQSVSGIDQLNLLIYDGKLAKWVVTHDVERKLQ